MTTLEHTSRLPAAFSVCVLYGVVPMSNPFLRNPVTLMGSGVLSGGATISALVALSVAPRTTLGLTALGSGLVALGNQDRLSQWSKDHFGSSDSAEAE